MGQIVTRTHVRTHARTHAHTPGSGGHGQESRVSEMEQQHKAPDWCLRRSGQFWSCTFLLSDVKGAKLAQTLAIHNSKCWKYWETVEKK